MLKRLALIVLLASLLLGAQAALAQGLQGEYYVWTGSSPPASPFLDYNRKGTRVDAAVDFTWSDPGIGGIGSDLFSVRWRGQVYLPTAGSWQFYTHSDDGIRLYVDNVLILERWSDAVLPEQGSGWMTMSAGWHDIALHYYENAGASYVRLRFEGPGMAKQIIPGTHLRSTLGKGVLADYYNGNWGGAQTLALSRNDGNINFYWGLGSPEPVVNVNNYSGRWRGKLIVQTTGTYTFYVNSNDGAALWVNGQELFNALSAQGSTAQERSGTIALTGGRNYFIQVHFNEFTDNASCQLSWSGPGIVKQVIPEQRLLAILNEAPSDIVLSPNLVYAPYVADEVVGTLSSFDVDNVTGAMPAQTHVYELVPGAGDDYNSYFKIVGNQLLTQTPGLGVGLYSIRVRTIDDGAAPEMLSYERALTVEVIDSSPPAAVCMPGEVFLNAQGQATATWDMVDGGSHDDYGIVSRQVVPNQFTCAHLGEQQVQLTVFDERGNTDACFATVTVRDAIAPAVVGRNLTVYLDALGQAVVSIGDVNNGSTDNCGIASLVLSQETFACADLGANTVQLTATDASGNSASATVVVTVLDVRPPTAAARNHMLVLDANSEAVLLPEDIDNGSTDNCGIVERTLSQSLFTCLDLGVNRVTLRTMDASGNVAQADAYVTVIQQEPPVAASHDLTVYLNQFGFVMVEPDDIDAGSVDKCGFQTRSLSQSIFTCDDIGDNQITYTVTGWSGLSVSSTAVISVMDVSDPALSFPGGNSVTVECGFPIVLPVPVISDNCYIEDASILNFNGLDPASPALGDYAVVYGARDLSGNTGAAILTVHVVDTIAPQMLSTPIAAECGVPFALPVGYVLDACGMVAMSVTESEGFNPDGPAVGDYSVEIVLTDQAGLSTSGVRSVLVRDTQPPEVVIAGQNPRYIAAGLPFALPEVHAEDACDGDLGASVSDLGGLDLENPVLGAYVLTVVSEPDSGGLTSTKELEIFVVPGTQPVLLIRGNAAPTYSCGDVYHEYGASAWDQEDGEITSAVVVTSDIRDGDVLVPGEYAVHYNVVDSSGWPADTQTRVVTVEDNCDLRVTAKNGKTRFYADTGDSVAFAVEVFGNIGTPAYQWKRETSDKAYEVIWDAPDASAYAIPYVLPEDEGRYLCEVSDAMSTAVSPAFYLFVGLDVPVGGISVLAGLSFLLATVGIRRSRQTGRNR